jgi:dolichol-phosphate mannosyltransferase
MELSEKLCLVIPTLNEASNITVVLERVRETLVGRGTNYEVVVVDDDSRDGTDQVVTSYAKNHPNVKLLVRKGKRGLAGAVIYGWQNSDATLLGVMDADLQHPPELLPDLLKAMDQGYDIAIGSRYVADDGTAGWNPLRRMISALGTWITLPLQRRMIRVKDPLSGFFIVRRRSIAGIPLHSQGFKILLEILVRGRIRSAAEIPFHFGLRHAGKSKANFKVALDYFSLLGRLSMDTLFKLGS